LGLTLGMIAEEQPRGGMGIPRGPSG